MLFSGSRIVSKPIVTSGEEHLLKSHKKTLEILYKKLESRNEPASRAFRSGEGRKDALFVYQIDLGFMFLCVATLTTDIHYCTDVLKEVKANFNPLRPTELSKTALTAMMSPDRITAQPKPIVTSVQVPPSIQEATAEDIRIQKEEARLKREKEDLKRQKESLQHEQELFRQSKLQHMQQPPLAGTFSPNPMQATFNPMAQTFDPFQAQHPLQGTFSPNPMQSTFSPVNPMMQTFEPFQAKPSQPAPTFDELQTFSRNQLAQQNNQLAPNPFHAQPVSPRNVFQPQPIQQTNSPFAQPQLVSPRVFQPQGQQPAPVNQQQQPISPRVFPQQAPVPVLQGQPVSPRVFQPQQPPENGLLNFSLEGDGINRLAVINPDWTNVFTLLVRSPTGQFVDIDLKSFQVNCLGKTSEGLKMIRVSPMKIENGKFQCNLVLKLPGQYFIVVKHNPNDQNWVEVLNKTLIV